MEMQLDTLFHLQVCAAAMNAYISRFNGDTVCSHVTKITQEMSSRDYMDDQDAEEPDDFIISLTAQVFCLPISLPSQFVSVSACL